jgi:hypothetical protein
LYRTFINERAQASHNLANQNSNKMVGGGRPAALGELKLGDRQAKACWDNQSVSDGPSMRVPKNGLGLAEEGRLVAIEPIKSGMKAN